MSIQAERLQELEDQKKKIYARMKEVRGIIDATKNGDERRQQQERLKILRDMYRDTIDQIEQLRPPQEKKHKAPKKKLISVGGSGMESGYDFFERCGAAWSDIEGRTWNEFNDIMQSGSANQANFLMKVLASAMETLTDRQYEYITAYYIGKKNMPQIAEEYGVRTCVVSRVIKAGLARLEKHIIASLKAKDCLDKNGFDFMGFANSTDVLSERQREMLYFLLSDDASMSDIARYLDRNKSTVSRSWERIAGNLASISTSIVEAPSVHKISRSDWLHKSEKEVAEMLGISPAIYFRNICRDEMVGPVSRYVYEILRLRGTDIKVSAKKFGLSANTIRAYWDKYQDIDIDSLPTPEPYIPESVKKVDTMNVRSMISRGRSLSDGRGWGTIGDNIDALTYQKLMEKCNAGT